jgi:hypothetical protein
MYNGCCENDAVVAYQLTEGFRYLLCPVHRALMGYDLLMGGESVEVDRDG